MQNIHRLYDTFQPTEYQLNLSLARSARTFEGNVVIQGTYTGENPLSFHAKDLTITEILCDGKPVADYRQDGDVLVLGTDIETGNKIVSIEFQGTITDAMHGLYPCYFEVDGEQKELLATQFESHHAREVFPCIDEPEAKAVFNLTLTTEPGVTVLGNMPPKTTSSDESTITTVFEPTPRMSSYLLAFVVGELHKKTATTKSGVEVNVWATHAQDPESLAFPLEVAVGSIDFFDDYFGVPYPLPKADHVALPDFSSGAMENWGLITYREIALLVDVNSSVSMREYVATVIAHETSHQWFGNLVTMKWWDDLWLNESFATIMEYFAVDALYPEWNVWNTFASQESLSALRRDQIAGVQAVKCEVNHPDEISTLFDSSIVYAKGGRLLKMLNTYIGDDAFRAGLQDYFRTHAYKNTIGADLWSTFSKSSGKDIEAFMDTWISQSGFPVVSVKTIDTGYSLSQERCVIGADADSSMWPIPLFSTQPEFPELLDDRNATVRAQHSLPLLNTSNNAHFVAQYDTAALSLIADAMKQGKLSVIDRLALLHETSLLARAGKTPTTDLLTLLDAYRNEDSEPVWNIISMVIADIKRFVEEDEPGEKALKSRVQALASPLYTSLGFDARADEAEQDTKLRAIILGLMAYSEDDQVVDQALAVFRSSEDLKTLPSETRGIILSIVAKHGTAEEFDRLVSAHEQTTNAELRDDLTSGLCSTRDADQIHRLLGRLKDQRVVKQQDVFRWFIYLLRNRHARKDAWNWMVKNWSWIQEMFAGDKSYDDFARYSASAFSTREWLDAYTTFFDPYTSETALRRSIEIGKTEISSRVEWIERDKVAMLATLAQ